MKKLVFLGNCQARRLEVLYNEKFSPVTGDTTEFIGSFQEPTPDVRRILAEADVIVAQALDSEQKIVIGKFETDARIVDFPLVTGVFLWPFAGEPHVQNQPLPDLHDGPYGRQFGDRWLNKKIKAGVDPADIAAEYEALDVAKAVNLDRMYELVVHRARERDGRTGFDLTSIIENSFSDERLFLAPENLELRLFRPLAQGVYERLGISSAAAAGVLESLWRSPFPVVHHPVHPSVARHFGLKFIRRNTRYRTLSGEAITFKEWVSRYVRYEWNEALRAAVRDIESIHRFDASAQALLDRIEAAMARTKGSVSGESCRAHLLFLKGDHAAAAKAAGRAAALDPTDPQLIGTQAFHLSDQGKHAEAEQLAQRVTQVWPHHVDGWRSLGTVLFRGGKLREAIDAFRRVLEVNPRDVDSARYLANILVEIGSTNQALSILAVATVFNPDVADLYGDLAHRLSDLGDFDSALVTVRRAVALDPENADRLRHLAAISEARGDQVGAEVALRRAAELEQQADSRPSMAVPPLDAGISDQALEERRRALRLEPANTDLRLRLLKDLIERDALEEAEVAFVEGLSIDPFDDRLHAALGEMLARQGRLREAEASASHAIRLNPDHAPHYRVLADILQTAGKLEAAKASYCTAIDLDPDNSDFRAALAFLQVIEAAAKARLADYSLV